MCLWRTGLEQALIFAAGGTAQPYRGWQKLHEGGNPRTGGSGWGWTHCRGLSMTMMMMVVVMVMVVGMIGVMVTMMMAIIHLNGDSDNSNGGDDDDGNGDGDDTDRCVDVCICICLDIYRWWYVYINISVLFYLFSYTFCYYTNNTWKQGDNSPQPFIFFPSLLRYDWQSKLIYIYLADVVQWIEYKCSKQKVAGSIPSQGTCLGFGPGPQ